MVTKRNRVTAEAGLGTPAAATFQAQSVPMIGAQRRESQASNYERLAQSLGAFSNALGGFGASLAARQKKEAEGQEQAVKDFIAVNDMSEDDRVRWRANNGSDENTDKLLGAATAEKKLIPEAEMAEMERRKEWTSNGWMRPTGQVAPGADGEEEPIMAAITPEYLVDEREAANEAVKAQYPDPKDAFIRNKLYAYNEQNFNSRLGELVKFREAENEAKYEGIMGMTGASALRQLHTKNAGNPDGLLKGFIEYGMGMAKSTGIKMSEKEFMQKHLPSVLKSLAQEAETNPALAPIINDLAEGRFGPGNARLMDTPRFQGELEKLFEAGVRSQAKAKFEADTSAMYTDIFNRLSKGEKIQDIEIKPIEVNVKGFQKVLSEKEIRETLGRRQDELVLTVDGVVAKEPSPEQITNLVIQSSKSGIPSPTLKTVFDKSIFEGNLDDDQAGRLEDAVVAYDAVKRFSPLGMDQFFKGNEKGMNILERIHSLSDIKGMDSRTAAGLAMKAETNKGGFEEFKKINKTVLDTLKLNRGIADGEREDIALDAFALLQDDPDVTADDVRTAVERAKASRLDMRPMVNGTPVKLPRGVDPVAGAQVMTAWSQEVSKIVGEPAENLYFVQAPDGSYRVLNKSTGLPEFNKDGEPATFDFDQALEHGQFLVKKAKAEELERKKALLKQKQTEKEAWLDPKNPINKPRSSSGPSAADTRAKPTDVFDVRGKKVVK